MPANPLWLGPIESALRPEIAVIDGLTDAEIRAELERLHQVNLAIDGLLYGGDDPDTFLDKIETFLEQSPEDYLDAAIENCEEIGIILL
jgi:hypothetical protein